MIKKNLAKIIFSFLCLFSFFILCACAKNSTNYYKVIKVVDGDTIYIDFNNNNFPDKEEKVRLNGIDAYENKVNPKINWQMRKYTLSEKEILTLGYLGYVFAQKELLGKEVKVKYSADKKCDKYNRPLVSIYYECANSKCKNFEEEILKKGLAEVYLKSNLAKKLKKYENLDLIYNNARNNKFSNEILYQFTKENN